MGAGTDLISNPRRQRDPGAKCTAGATRTLGSSTHLPLPPTCQSRPASWQPLRLSLHAGVRLARTVPATPRALGRRDTHHPGRRPGPENRWPRRGARDSRLSLTQKMKLNPKSRYLMHLLPPLTGMVLVGLAWDKRHARLGQKELDNRLRHAAARGWPEAPLLKSATPYGAPPAALRMCRGMLATCPAHALIPSQVLGLRLHSQCRALPAPCFPSSVPEILFPSVFLLTDSGSF